MPFGMRINRRHLVQGLLLAGPAIATPAIGASRGAGPRVEFGLADAPGSGRHALAQRCAHVLAKRLQARAGDATTVTVVALPPGTDAQAWCAAAPGVARVVLTTTWRAASGADASCPATPAPRRELGLVPLGVLARSPLVLLASRSAPAGWPAVHRAAQASAVPWRCGIDASDQATVDASTLLMNALGLAGVQTLPFRGPAQLLPALAGDRFPLAVQTVGQYLGERWHALSADEAAGNLGDAVAMHRRGEVQLLTVADRHRLPGAPGVPTLDELRGCRGNDIGRCLLLLAPAGLDAALSRHLSEAVAGLEPSVQLTTS